MKRKSITVNVTQRILDTVAALHLRECGPGCQHNQAAEAIAMAIKAAGFTDVEVDTWVLPSGQRTVVRIP